MAKNVLTSGTTPISTSDANPVTVLDASGGWYTKLIVFNGGTTDGFFCIGDGSEDSDWIYLPAGKAVALDGVMISDTTVKVKRRSSDLTNIFAVAWR